MKFFPIKEWRQGMSATHKVGKPGVLLLAIFLLAASLGWENVKSARADVEATFWMYNPTSEDITLTA